MDAQQIIKKQIVEFLNEFKNRFNLIFYYEGMPGKIGYFTKLKSGIHTLSVFLTELSMKFAINMEISCKV